MAEELETTCWTVISAAANGDPSARDSFVRIYEPIGRAFLAARWSNHSMRKQLEDALQDTFLECFKTSGVLDRIGKTQPASFRAFFHGVLRNVARRYEDALQPHSQLPENICEADTSASKAFDRAWARSLLQEAGRFQAKQANEKGGRALKRLELLRLRFQEGLAIREIATLWNEEAVHVHREYAIARDEFRLALRKIVSFNMPSASQAELELACQDLLALLK